MSSQQWQQLRKLFDHAAMLDPSARDSFVRELTERDPDLGSQLQDLLLHDSPNNDKFSGAVQSLVTELSHEDSVEQIGRQFGPYRILRQVGEGGMGAVYLAERSDGEFEQQVAIKLIGAGAFSQTVVSRFRAERQILARLSHPNIARIVDGGTTDEGVTYLVMEYVDGEPITQYCNSHNLGLQQRLRLFLRVCDAIEFAHRNLVVHRDIKPSNILVAADGQPKLLDFGIAKLLGNNEDDAQPATQYAMTPDYASPEQVLGEPVTTLCDVYSLGVLCYEILTGQRPYVLSGKRPSEIEKELLETNPVKPSTVTQVAGSDSPQAVGVSRRSLRGELDAIVLMAMRRDPQGRYQSVQALSTDVKRFLRGEAVVAKGRSIAYLTKKFLRRNRWPLGLGMVVVAGIASATVFHISRIEAERDRVKKEAKTSASVTQYLQSIFEVANPDESMGERISAREVLDRGARRLEIELADQPEIKARLLTSIGGVYKNLGLHEEALVTTDKAVVLQEQLKDTVALTASLVQKAGIHRESGSYSEARAALEYALRLTDQQVGRNSEHAAAVLFEFGEVSRMEGNYAASLEYYQQASVILEDIQSEDATFRVKAKFAIGQILHFLDDVEGAEKYMREAVVEMNALGVDSPIDRSTFYHNLATVLHDKGDFKEAEALYQDVYDTELRILGEDHPSRDVAITNLGRLYRDTGQLELARKYLTQAVELAERLNGREHFFTAYNAKNLADLLFDKKDYAESRLLFEEVLITYTKTLEPDHPQLASAQVGYARLLNAMGEWTEAEQQATHAVNICQQALPDNHWLSATANSVLSDAMLRQGRHQEALSRLLTTWEGMRSASSEHAVVGALEEQLVQAYQLVGDSENAAVYQQLIDNRCAKSQLP